MFRTDRVDASYFQNLPPHREWTVVAFRIASHLTVHFHDTPTFCIYDTDASESKKESYIEHAVEIIEDMLRWNTDPRIVPLILHRRGVAYRTMCSHFRLRKDFQRAWRAYWNAVRSRGGWRHIPYGALLLVRSASPAADLSRRYLQWRST
jgi:hypothetical protein